MKNNLLDGEEGTFDKTRLLGGPSTTALEQWKKKMIEKVKENFKKNGFVAPVALILKGEKMFIESIKSNEKDENTFFIKEAVEKIKPDTFMFITEGWFFKNWKYRFNPPSDHQAIRSIIIIYEDKRRKDFYIIKIKEDGGASIGNTA